jgi:hypothetical protein
MFSALMLEHPPPRQELRHCGLREPDRAMAQADALKVAQARPFQDGLVIHFQPSRHIMLGQ